MYTRKIEAENPVVRDKDDVVEGEEE